MSRSICSKLLKGAAILQLCYDEHVTLLEYDDTRPSGPKRGPTVGTPSVRQRRGGPSERHHRVKVGGHNTLLAAAPTGAASSLVITLRPPALSPRSATSFPSSTSSSPHLGQFKDLSLPLGYQLYPQLWHQFCGRFVNCSSMLTLGLGLTGVTIPLHHTYDTGAGRYYHHLTKKEEEGFTPPLLTQSSSSS